MSSEHRHAEEERPVAAFRSTQLFGGALIVDLPSTFADVRYVAQCVALIFWLIKTSTLRQVPDSQEVYLDKEGYTSIIFDLLDRVGPPGSTDATDGAALTIHLEEIVDSDTETLKVWNTTPTRFSKLP